MDENRGLNRPVAAGHTDILYPKGHPARNKRKHLEGLKKGWGRVS